MHNIAVGKCISRVQEPVVTAADKGGEGWREETRGKKGGEERRGREEKRKAAQYIWTEGLSNSVRKDSEGVCERSETIQRLVMFSFSLFLQESVEALSTAAMPH